MRQPTDRAGFPALHSKYGQVGVETEMEETGRHNTDWQWEFQNQEDKMRGRPELETTDKQHE